MRNPEPEGPGFPVLLSVQGPVAERSCSDRRTADGGTPNYNVTPLGYRYYEHLKTRDAGPIEQVERGDPRFDRVT
jgi:hypothetical protein